MEKSMENLVSLIQPSEEKIPKVDNMAQGTHKNKYHVHVEQPSINKHIPRGFDSNSGDNHGWFPKGIPLSKIDMRKFDGKIP